MSVTQNQKIPYSQPSITDLEVQYATDATANGWGDHCYDYIIRFEESFKAYLGVKYAIATSSCTGSLHMGMAALGIGPGDEVIMANTNWIATAAPIVHLGAKPIFVDILPDSWCLDPKQVQAAITTKTKAIVAVHLYGNLCMMDELLGIGDSYGIPIIEDAAEAIGSTYQGQYAGTLGIFGAFSFHGTKTITTGEGGLFVTNSRELYEKVFTLSNHGRSLKQKKQFWPDVIGFKYKMSNVQAAIGCAQLSRVDQLVERKREIFFRYRSLLPDFVSMNPEFDGCLNSYWMPTIQWPDDIKLESSSMIDYLKNNGMDARPFFAPLSSTGLFPFSEETPNSTSAFSRALNLPSYHDMTNLQIQYVANKVTECFSNV